MILADTSVWVDHLSSGDHRLVEPLEQSQVLMHPFVLGELALGSLRQRDLVLGSMQDLPQAIVATDKEVLAFIEHRALFGLGIGYVDAHLLASVRLTAGASLWTRDKRLLAVAERLVSRF
jgi:predicted nucleic acid-binding protein